MIAAGIPERFSGGVGGRGGKRDDYTDHELLDELRVVYGQLTGRPLTIDVFKPLGRMNPETIRRRFGSWSAALERAGLSVAPLGRRYFDEQYFENLLAVWAHYGRQPTYGEMDKPPSRIPSGAYEAKWGTWKKALLAFIERAESEPAASSNLSSTEPVASPQAPQLRLRDDELKQPTRCQEEHRQAPLGLRYRVLLRDQFRCVLCGRSPSTTLGCELHVEHTIPFSRGDKTTLENLRSTEDVS